MLRQMDEPTPVSGAQTFLKVFSTHAKRASELLDVANPAVNVADLIVRDNYSKPLTQEEAIKRAQANLYTLRGFYVRVAVVAVFLGEACVGECFWTLAILGAIGGLLYVTVSDMFTRERKLVAAAALVLYALLFTPIIPVAFVSTCTAAVLCTAHAAVYVPPPTFC